MYLTEAKRTAWWKRFLVRNGGSLAIHNPNFTLKVLNALMDALK